MVLRPFVVLFLFWAFVGLPWGQAETLPMQPLFNSKTRHLVGVRISADSLGLGYLKNSNVIITGSALNRVPRVEATMQQLRQIGLYPYFVNGDIIGTLRPYTGVTYKNSTTIGLTLSFGNSSRDDVLVLGTETVYGFKTDISIKSDGNLLEGKGLWVNDPLTKFIDQSQSLVSGATPLEMTESLLSLAQVIPLEKSTDSYQWPESQFKALLSLPRNALVVHDNDPSPETSSLGEKSTVWSETEKYFQQFQAQENRWNTFLQPLNDKAPIWNYPEAQNALQQLCRKMTTVPVRCRIAANLVPYAYSYPGGDIFVTAGLLRAVPNEDTLAFFLAHEINHVIQRDFSRNIEDQTFRQKFYVTLSLVSSVLSYKFSIVGLVENIATWAQNTNPSHLYSALMSNYTTSNELMADRNALIRVTELGYNPKSVLEGLDELHQQLENIFGSQKATQKVISSRYSSWPERILQLQSLHFVTTTNTSPSRFPLELCQRLLKKPYQYFQLGISLNKDEN